MNKNIESLLEYLQCIYTIQYFEYDPQGHLLYPEKETILLSSYAKQYLNLSRNKEELIISENIYGIEYITYISNEGNHHVLGPFSAYNIDKSKFIASINHSTIKERRELEHELDSLPYIDFNTVNQFSKMFYYALTKTKIETIDIKYNIQLPTYKEDIQTEIYETYQLSYYYEKIIYDSISNGKLPNLNLLYENADSIKYRKIYKANYLRNRKDLSLSNLSMCTHAAIEAGMSVIEAYNKQSHFATMIEETNNPLTLSEINTEMYKYYSTRTHEIKSKEEKDTFIQDVEEYIKSNIYNNISIEMISNYFGYTTYYFSRKFYSRTNKKINEYIIDLKIETSLKLLQHTSYSIFEIAEMLKFPNSSYYCSEFKKRQSTTPNQYRKTRSQ